MGQSTYRDFGKFAVITRRPIKGVTVIKLRAIVFSSICAALVLTSVNVSSAATRSTGVHRVAIILMRPPGRLCPVDKRATRRAHKTVHQKACDFGWWPRSQVNKFINGKGKGSLRHWYAYGSTKQLRITGQVYGSFNTPGSLAVPLNWRPGSPTPNACKINAWMTAATAQAKRYQHFHASSYDSIMVYTPRVADQNHFYDVCHFDGIAEVNGSATFLNGKKDLGTVAHEIGHNMGLLHAGRYMCGRVDPSCLNPYADSYDAMGCRITAPCTRYYNAYHQYLLGWLRASQARTVTVNGTYPLTAIESNSHTALKMITVVRDDGSFYAVSNRIPTGYDAVAGVRGIWIHRIKIEPGVVGGHSVGPDDTELLSSHVLRANGVFSDGQVTIKAGPVRGATASVVVQLTAAAQTAAANPAANPLAHRGTRHGYVTEWTSH
jgi:M6 family metalloprotease-like protein